MQRLLQKLAMVITDITDTTDTTVTMVIMDITMVRDQL